VFNVSFQHKYGYIRDESKTQYFGNRLPIQARPMIGRMPSTALNFPFPWWLHLDPHLTHSSLGSREPITQTASHQPFLHGSKLCPTHTGHATCNTGSNTPHLCMACRRCGLKTANSASQTGTYQTFLINSLLSTFMSMLIGTSGKCSKTSRSKGIRRSCPPYVIWPTQTHATTACIALTDKSIHQH